MDKASPFLQLELAGGQHINKATLEVTRSSGDQSVFYRVVMTEVNITSVKSSGVAKAALSTATLTGPIVPIEEVSLSFGTIEWTFNEFGGSFIKGWDVCNDKSL